MRKVSLIVSVYNKTRELELIFKSLELQTYRNFDIIIAEDGQNEAIAKVVNTAQRIFSGRLSHVNQEDIGFRKNKILNKAIQSTGSDQLIFIDGDCIPHIEFINAHFNSFTQNTVLCGRRVSLGRSLSAKVMESNIDDLITGKWNLRILRDSIAGNETGSKNAEEGFVIRNKALRSVITKKDEHILGCNFSIPRQLLININGFDENYEGPGWVKTQI